MSAGSITDKALVATAVSAPWWLEYLNWAGAAIIITCGAAVGIIRLMIAWRDWRNGGKGE